MGCAGSRMPGSRKNCNNGGGDGGGGYGGTGEAEGSNLDNPGAPQQPERQLVYCKVMCDEREWDETQCILSRQETFKLWTSWNFVHDRVCNAGVHMFLLLFKQHPLLLAIFKKFSANLESPDRLDGLLTRDNPDLKRHSATVMGLLDDAIVNLDKRDLVRERLRATGKRHRMFVGFQGSFFLLMRDPFLGSVQATLADKCTPAMLRIYEKTIDWVLGELCKGFEEAGEAENSAPGGKEKEEGEKKDGKDETKKEE